MPKQFKQGDKVIGRLLANKSYGIGTIEQVNVIGKLSKFQVRWANNFVELCTNRGIDLHVAPSMVPLAPINQNPSLLPDLNDQDQNDSSSDSSNSSDSEEEEIQIPVLQQLGVVMEELQLPEGSTMADLN